MQKQQPITNKFKTLLPQLSSQLKKGDNGKSCVIGGSFEYTGAPFYCALSQLKTVILKGS